MQRGRFASTTHTTRERGRETAERRAKRRWAAWRAHACWSACCSPCRCARRPLRCFDGARTGPLQIAVDLDRPPARNARDSFARSCADCGLHALCSSLYPTTGLPQRAWWHWYNQLHGKRWQTPRQLQAVCLQGMWLNLLTLKPGCGPAGCVAHRPIVVPSRASTGSEVKASTV